jgi:hypothetical protein
MNVRLRGFFLYFFGGGGRPPPPPPHHNHLKAEAVYGSDNLFKIG